MSTFDNFLTNGVATKAFIEEFEHVCYKVYMSYKHCISFDAYLDFCWDKLFERKNNFNPELGSSGNFIYSLLKNELIRVNSRYSRETTSEISDSLNEESNYVSHNPESIDYDEDLEDFCNLALSRGLDIDKLQLKLQQDFLDFHLLIQVYQWFKINGPRKIIVGSL